VRHLDRSKDEHTLHPMRKIAPGFGGQNWAFGGLTGVVQYRSCGQPGRRVCPF
jgi:hypothetical protein